MTLKLRYDSTNYDIVGFGSDPTASIFKLRFSSRETTYSTVLIDFTASVATDLPIKLQQMEIIDIDDSNKVIYTGYLDSYELPEFETGSEFVILTLSLLNPINLAGKRTITVQENEVTLTALMTTILQPLVDDGFTIEENNLVADEISVRYVRNSIENIMNDLSNKYKFLWYIDQDKKIYLNMIADVEASPASYLIDENNLDYISRVHPLLHSVDYANKILVKNALVYSSLTSLTVEKLLPASISLSDGGVYNFLYPIDISEDAGTRIQSLFSSITLLILVVSGKDLTISYNQSTSTYTFGTDLGFLGIDDNTKDCLLMRDPELPQIITGFKWNTTAATSTVTSSASVLIPYIVEYTDPAAIALNVDKVSPTGIIEKIVDAHEQIFTIEEIDLFAKNQVTLNNNETKSAVITFKDRISTAFETFLSVFMIGEKLTVNLPNQFITGEFIITDLEISQTKEVKTVVIKCRNTNLLENYVDLFRKDYKEENPNQTLKYIEAVYITDESIDEAKQIQVWNGSEWVQVNEND